MSELPSEAPAAPQKEKKKGKEKKKSRAALKKEAELLRIAREAQAAEAKEKEIAAEEARLKAIVDARLAEEDRVRKVAEAKRLDIQLNEDREWMEQRRDALKIFDEKAQAQSAWEHHVLCSDLPDVTRESELNQFRTLWQDPFEIAKDPVNSIGPMVEAMTRVENVISALMRTSGHAHELWDHKALEWARNFTNALRDRSCENIDALTTKLLMAADDHEDPETTCFQSSYQTSEVLYGLWVHCTVRRDGPRRMKIDWPEIGVKIGLPPDLLQVRTAIRFLYTSYDHLVGMLAYEQRAGEKQAETLNPWPEEETVDETAQKRLEGIDPSIPYVSVGGVIHIQQLAVPPAPRKVKGWKIREMSELTSEIKEIDFPANSEHDGNGDTFLIQFTLPDYVIIGDQPPLYGWWDAKEKTWSLENIRPKPQRRSTFEAEVQLGLTKPFAMVQPRALDFPYRSWSIRPVSHESVMLRLRGSRFTVELELNAGKAAVRSPRFEVLANHGLLDTFMPPGQLLMRLARSGLNLMPNDDDSVFARKPLRDQGLEPYLHEELAMVAHCFEIKGSPFNSNRPTSETLFAVRINKTMDPLLMDFVASMEKDGSSRPVPAAAPEAARPESSDDRAGAGSGEDEDMVGGLPPVDTPEGSDVEDSKADDVSEHGQMSGFETDLLMGFVGKQKKKKITVNSWVHVLASKNHFSVVQVDQRGVVKEDPVKATQESQSSLRRLLVHHYAKFRAKGQIPYDLALMYEAVDQRESTLNLQESLRRALNLVRVLVFY